MSFGANTLSPVKGPREARTFPRFTTPMQVRIGDEHYEVFNWSTQGLGVINIPSDIAVGNVIHLVLLIKTDEANIRIDLTAEIIWRNMGTKRCGMVFLNPEPKKVALMNELMDINLSLSDKMYAKQTFGIVKADLEQAKLSSGLEQVKRIIGLLLFAAIGVGSLLLLANMLYNRLFVFEAASASIFSETTDITSPAEGIIKNIIAPGVVKQGQTLSTITLPSGQSSVVVSPCACETVSIIKRNGSFVRAGETLINLVKSNAKPVVSVRIAFHHLERVVKGASVNLLFLDGTAIKGAKMREMEKNFDDHNSLVTIYVEPGRLLTPSQVGQPVYALVDTGPW